MQAVEEAPLVGLNHTPERAAAIAYLDSLHPNIGVAVWAPRPDPQVRGSSKLLYYNQPFMELCDSASLRCGTMERVIPQTLNFVTDRARQEFRASMERIFCMVDALHSGAVNHTTAQVVHISLLGRFQYVHMEIIALRLNGVLAELIFGEVLLSEEQTLPADLQVPYGFVDERFLPRAIPFAEELSPDGSDSPPQSSVHEQPEPAKPAPVTARKPLRWTMIPEGDLVRDKRKEPKRIPMRDFRCAECSTNVTTQRRYARHIMSWPSCAPSEPRSRRAPDGSLTLCNRCGLRWKRFYSSEATLAT